MQKIPPQLRDIANRLNQGERVNRRSIESLLGWFLAKRRGASVIANIRSALSSLGLETDPDFAVGEPADLISFRLVNGARQTGISVQNVDESEPLEIVSTLRESSKSSIKTNDLVDGSSDDFLEPETDDEQPFADADDKPVFSKPIDWAITSLREKWESNLLELQPEFQREYVWKLKPELPSRLIESVLLEIPIPPLYFGRLNGGRLEVIDGQQRLTSLIEFISNKFPLQRLTRMPSLNGLTFGELSQEFQEKIKDTPIRTVEINAGNNAELRYEIFERLNRGSMPLNEQELRNCVYRGKFNGLLADLERDKKWRQVKGGDKPEPRFKEREMILRFFAFANRGQFYKGGLKRFLNSYMDKHAPKTDDEIEEQAQMFRQTIQNVYIVFGANSGRLFSIPSNGANGKWNENFSIAAFEIQASALLGYETARVQKVADQVREYFLLLLLTDKAIQGAISQATGGSVPTKLRWTAFKELVKPLLENTAIEPRFFSYEFRRSLFSKNPVCSICNNEIHSFEDCAVDHIIPYSRGGKTVTNNGQLSHRSCNAIKNAKFVPNAVDT